MDIIEEKLGGPLRALWDIALFDYVLLFITAFLASVLLLVLFGAELYFAFLPAAAITAFYYLRSRRHHNPLRSIERGNPALRERLSAAYDNRQNENVIVKDLVREVSYELDMVNTGVFLDRGRTNTYIFASIVIVFILLSLLLYGFEGFDVGGLFGGGGGSGSSQGSGGGSGGGGGGGESGVSESSQDRSFGQGGSQDIYGDASIAKIEGQDLQLEIHPEYGEAGDSGLKQGAQETNAIMTGFVQATEAETYSENIPVELEGAVRKYFEKLAEGSSD